jgi:hypothetical protein
MKNPMKRDDDSLDLLIQKLRWLRLPGMAQLVASLLVGNIRHKRDELHAGILAFAHDWTLSRESRGLVRSNLVAERWTRGGSPGIRD